MAISIAMGRLWGMADGPTLCRWVMSRLLAPEMGTGLYSKVPSKSAEHLSGICAETRVTAVRAERATAYFMLIGCGCGCVRNVEEGEDIKKL